jgi:hypothetical protein
MTRRQSSQSGGATLKLCIVPPTPATRHHPNGFYRLSGQRLLLLEIIPSTEHMRRIEEIDPPWKK